MKTLLVKTGNLFHAYVFKFEVIPPPKKWTDALKIEGAEIAEHLDWSQISILSVLMLKLLCVLTDSMSQRLLSELKLNRTII